jgi:hypothetical protein
LPNFTVSGPERRVLCVTRQRRGIGEYGGERWRKEEGRKGWVRREVEVDKEVEEGRENR